MKINPWDDKAEMVKTAPVAITSARDKMPFEVTPFFPRLARFGATPPLRRQPPHLTQVRATSVVRQADRRL